MKICPKCGTQRDGLLCWKCGERTFEADSKWIEPELPSVQHIRDLAYQVGYAIGEHGSKERDLDLIAVPWTEDAISEYDLITIIANGLSGVVLKTEKKPFGRLAVSIQQDGYFKLVDLSVFPRYNFKTHQ